MFETYPNSFARGFVTVVCAAAVFLVLAMVAPVSPAWADDGDAAAIGVQKGDGNADVLGKDDSTDENVMADDGDAVSEGIEAGAGVEGAVPVENVAIEGKAEPKNDPAPEETPVVAEPVAGSTVMGAEDSPAPSMAARSANAIEDDAASAPVDQVAPEQEAANEAPSKNDASLVTQKAAVIADGAYTIKVAATYGQALGNDNSYSTNAAVKSYAIDGSYDQMFYFQHVKNGFYSIFSVHSGLALTASGGKVVQASYGGSNSQLFEVRDSGGLFALIAKAGAITVSSNSDAKVQGYTGASTQKFRLIEAPLVIPGVQALRASADARKAVRAKDGSATAGADAQVASYSNNGSFNLVVQRKGSGYAVRPVSSGFYLAPSGSTVRQVANVNTWDVQFSTNSGRCGVMLVKGDSAAQVSGGAVIVAKVVPSTAQSFLPKLSKLVIDGYYNIIASNGKLIDVYDGSFSNGANIQVFTGNGSGAQVFRLTDEGGGLFSIQSSKSYKVLEAKGGGTGEGTNVWQYDWNGTPAQLWAPIVDSAGRITFVNAKSGKVLTVSGSNVSIKGSSGTAAQHWALVPTSQYSLTGNTKLDRIVANVLGTHTTLRSAFNYVSYNFSYRNGNKHWSGWSLSDSTSQSYAIEMYNYGSGNCYRFASLFAWLARGLGYTDVTVRTGWVVGYSAPQAPHGWVTINGYVCDPDMQHEASGRNWYWQTYASAPTAYYSW